MIHKFSDSDKAALLSHGGFLDRLSEVKEKYRTKPGDDISSFDTDGFVRDMKERHGGKTPCWELKDCQRWAGGSKEAEFGMCITFPWGGWHCWALAGTLCGGMVQGSAAAKEGNCQMCQHYIELMEDDPSKLKSDSAYFSAVMQSVMVGIATVNGKGIIDFQSSRRFQEFFGANVAGKNLCAALGMDEGSTAKMKEWLTDVFNLYGQLSWDMLLNMFPLKDSDLRVGERHYRFTVSPFLRRDPESGKETLHRLLLQATDVSLEVRALELAARERAATDVIIARVKNIGSFREFLNHAHEMIPRAEGLVKRFMEGDRDAALLEETYRIMHTLKGTSGNFAMESFVKTAHESEEYFSKLLKICRREPGGAALEGNLAEYKEVFDSFRTLQQELKEAVRFMAEHAGIEIELNPGAGAVINMPTRTINEALAYLAGGNVDAALKLLAQAKEAPLKGLFQEMAAQAERVARAAGKQVMVVPEGEEVALDKDLHPKLFAVLLHIVRNAVDHGLEEADERSLNGKEPFGILELTAKRENGTVTISVKDDGKGIDVARIRQKAGLPNAMPDEEALMQIFKPGFSTRDSASTVSGRGVGMDVVKTTVEEELRGTIKLRTVPREGTEFIITFPAAAHHPAA